jgi:putative transcriptional regulator
MSENTKPIIAEICEAYGIGQTELSKRFEIPLRTVQDWHAGRRNPPSYVVNMVVKLLIIERNKKAEK